MSDISFSRVSGALGAEVSGVDLRQPLTTSEFETLHQALAEHLVLFFRDQDITPEQHRDFAARFGPLQTHPAYPTVPGVPEVTILHNDRDRKSKIEKWHTDMTFKAQPPLGSILHGHIIPEIGGDTLFASMEAAFEDLSDRWQTFLDGLFAVHSFAHGFKESLAEPGGYARLRGAIDDNPPVEHPVIRRHPVTGRRSLFVNTLFTTHIVGMSESESRAVLDFLYQHATREEFTCRFSWTPHAIAFWDNRATQHKPVNDYWPAERKLQRVTVEGDRPS